MNNSIVRACCLALPLITTSIANANPLSEVTFSVVSEKNLTQVSDSNGKNTDVTPAGKTRTAIEKKIVLQGGLFSENSDMLGPNSEQSLAGLVSNLEKIDNILSIGVVGHSDSIGQAKKNLQLSTLRARSVQAFLQSAYPEIPVSAAGMGDTRPAHSNATVKGRELNRRVEIFVTVDTTESST